MADERKDKTRAQLLAEIEALRKELETRDSQVDGSAPETSSQQPAFSRPITRRDALTRWISPVILSVPVVAAVDSELAFAFPMPPPLGPPPTLPPPTLPPPTLPPPTLPPPTLPPPTLPPPTLPPPTPAPTLPPPTLPPPTLPPPTPAPTLPPPTAAPTAAPTPAPTCGPPSDENIFCDGFEDNIFSGGFSDGFKLQSRVLAKPDASGAGPRPALAPSTTPGLAGITALGGARILAAAAAKVLKDEISGDKGGKSAVDQRDPDPKGGAK